MHPPSAFYRHTLPPTQWSLVRLAFAEDRPGADQALNDLCATYQRPILTYILRHGYKPDAAEELRAAFFHHLLSKNAIASAESTGVRLRAFLFQKLESFLIDQHRHANAQKRGAGKVIAAEDLSEEHRHLTEPVDGLTPFIAAQRQWLETIITSAMTRLREDQESKGNTSLFQALAPFITSSNEQTLAMIAEKFGRPVNTLKSDISRLRAKCQKLIRDQIAATLEDDSEASIDAELKELMGYR